MRLGLKVVSSAALLCVFVCLSTIGSPAVAQSVVGADGVPDWIWQAKRESEHEPRPTQQVAFEKKFELREPVRAAQLRVAADFCNVSVSSNGKQIAVIEAFSPNVDLDVTDAIALGSNVLRIEADTIPGPSAVALSLLIFGANQSEPTSIVTNEAWSVLQVGSSTGSSNQHVAESLGRVSHGLWGTGRRGSKVDAIENYEQWQQAKAGTKLAEEQFWTSPDFKIALVRSALPDEGSWVSMAFDPKGRLTIAKEEKGLLRMTLDPSRKSVERVEPLIDQLLECRGMVYAHDALYVNANNSKGLYRLRDSNGDDVPDEIDLMRAFPGSVGHGRNDLALAPDGRIFSIHGDSVDVPTTQIVDRTSPFRESRKGKVSREGHVICTDSEGKSWELLCAGLRNPFGLAANPDGEWFSYDADAEFDMGAPWYRPTRIVHLVSGADFGWRGVTGKWPPYFPDHPDNAMPTVDIGKGSPTAVLFGTQARFPSEYRRALFVLDWTYGRVLAVHLVPRGAGYRAQAETFLQGRPLNVTDLAIGPDGDMYIITGGRKTQSALYRVSYAGRLAESDDKSKHEQESAAAAEIARKLRKQIEQLHIAREPNAELAWQHLNSADWTIRHAARIAIEHQPFDSWRDRALQETRRWATTEALLAVARSGDASATPEVVDRLLRLPVNQLQLGEVWGVLQVYSLLLDSSPNALLPKRIAIVAQLEPLIPRLQNESLHICRCGTNSQVLGALALLLSNLGADSASVSASQSLLSSSNQQNQMLGLFALRNTKTAWNDDLRRTYFRVLNEGTRFVSGEGMPKFLSKIREEALATLSEAEKSKFADLLAPVAPIAEPLPPARPLVKQWSVEELTALISNSQNKPDLAKGELLFRDALCSRCHRAGARGPAVGPDLTHVASRFSRRDLIESMVAPSKVVAENYRSVQVTTADGRSIVGRVVVEGDYRSQKLQIATDPLNPSQVVELDKKEVKNLRESLVSPMPTGLLDTFQPEEIADLIGYLLASHATQHAWK